jgi:hypothetical protein
MIWPIVAIIILCFGFVLSLIYLPQGNMRDLAISGIPLAIGFLGFTVKDFIDEWKLQKAAAKNQNEIIDNIKRFFPNYLTTELKLLDLGNESDEVKILTELLRINFPQNSDQFINGCILCYFCKKWDQHKSLNDFNKIKQYADMIGIKNFHTADDLKTFLDLYYHVIRPVEIVNIDNEKLLHHFIEHYYKEIFILKITKDFNQTKNLHDTLKILINEGKFSSFGITQETLKKIQKDVRSKLSIERTFLVLLDGADDDLKGYLRSLPGLSGSAPFTKNIGITAKYGMYIVKPPKIKSSKEFVEIIKSFCNKDSETIVRIIPLDFKNGEVFTIPANQSFISKNMQNCYDAIEWFKTGSESEDSLLWNEIAKSTITPNELFSIIPFNIFCQGILESERIFLVTRYESIKSSLGVSKLNEWKNIDPNLIATYLLSQGKPDYNQEEITFLKLHSHQESEEKVKKRFIELATQIVNGAKQFDEAIK